MVSVTNAGAFFPKLKPAARVKSAARDDPGPKAPPRVARVSERQNPRLPHLSLVRFKGVDKIPTEGKCASTGASKYQLEPSTVSDLALDSKTWSSAVIGKLSSWIQLDRALTPNQRKFCLDALEQELSWGSHLGVYGIILPCPTESCELYAAALSRIGLTSICTTQLMVRIPLLRQENGTEVDGWNTWNNLRLLCDQNPRLQVCLEFTADLPESDPELNRWLAEPVRSVIIPTDAFLTNKQGFPVLSKRHKAFLLQLFRTRSLRVRRFFAQPVAMTQAPALVQAVRKRDVARLRTLLAERADVNEESDRGVTAFQTAVKAGLVEVLEVLASARADPNVGNSCDGTPLTSAAFQSHQDVVELLLRQRADVNAAYHQCYPPIFAAAHKGNLQLLRTLLSARASANTQCFDQTTAILQTSWFGHKEVVAELIAARADLTVKRTDRTIQDCDATAVFLAAKRGHTDTVRLLLEHRCSVNDATVDGEGPLFAAAAANHPDTVQVLLDARADLQQSTNYQELPTALHAASERGLREVASLLLAAGADPTLRAPEGQSPLDLAKDPKMRELLEANGTKRARQS
ncbi:unnamed protein product [Effrenium voratum]|nr:unnamed protein product [Effrenium voratum]